MARRKTTEVKTLQKRGSGLCVVVPHTLLESLAWNRDDALRLDVISGSLVVTRIDLPSVPDLRIATKGKEDAPGNV